MVEAIEEEEIGRGGHIRPRFSIHFDDDPK
jgi:hypothetical protein